MADRVVLTIGTKKGVFVAEAAKPRRSFALRGPLGPGVPVYATLIDTRGTPRLYASSCNPFFGMKVLRSTDMGKTFKETKSAPAFPKDDGRALVREMLMSSADIVPQPEDHRLVVRLHSLANPRRNHALTKLCATLNTLEVCYPGTDLKLVYEAPEVA